MERYQEGNTCNHLYQPSHSKSACRPSGTTFPLRTLLSVNPQLHDHCIPKYHASLQPIWIVPITPPTIALPLNPPFVFNCSNRCSCNIPCLVLLRCLALAYSQAGFFPNEYFDTDLQIEISKIKPNVEFYFNALNGIYTIEQMERQVQSILMQSCSVAGIL